MYSHVFLFGLLYFLKSAIVTFALHTENSDNEMKDNNKIKIMDKIKNNPDEKNEPVVLLSIY